MYVPSHIRTCASIKIKSLAKMLHFILSFARASLSSEQPSISRFLHFKNKLCGHFMSLLCFYFKEVIQPQVPLRLPCYDFTPVMNHTVVNVPPKVRLSTSGAAHSHGVTGGVYKARERIHRDMLIRDY
jgi:hypothetical protein